MICDLTKMSHNFSLARRGLVARALSYLTFNKKVAGYPPIVILAHADAIDHGCSLGGVALDHFREGALGHPKPAVLIAHPPVSLLLVAVDLDEGARANWEPAMFGS
jgi:hypothetical protein